MKKVVVKQDEDTIDISDVEQAYNDGKIVVNVYKNKVSFLCRYSDPRDYYCFRDINPELKITDVSSVSSSINLVLAKNIGLIGDMFVFEDLVDFAKAIIENGWK